MTTTDTPSASGRKPWPDSRFSPVSQRDAAAAERFFRKALAQPHTASPWRIVVDENQLTPVPWRS
jgi:hypothetical protein